MGGLGTSAAASKGVNPLPLTGVPQAAREAPRSKRCARELIALRLADHTPRATSARGDGKLCAAPRTTAARVVYGRNEREDPRAAHAADRAAHGRRGDGVRDGAVDARHRPPRTDGRGRRLPGGRRGDGRGRAAGCHRRPRASRGRPADVAREDRGPPCGIEYPFVASLPVDEIPNPGAAVDYDLYVVLARDDRGLYAYTAMCTHQRCVVVVDNDGTRCPCHDSVFDADGAVTQGPATRALPNHPVQVCDGRVFVDRTHVVSAGTRVPV
ncbi:MAG: Rieske (2Fe-2S) protein [Deltaproteobacteria bacterium]|nr:Rieske (2Fe-2S) protein [Deltaproteobacteria bacterium]